MKYILLVASASSRFTCEFIENILIPDCKIDIANIDSKHAVIQPSILNFYRENQIGILDFSINNTKRFHRIKILWSQMINIIKLKRMKKYDVVHFHYLTENILSLLFYKPRGNVILTIYGSDYLRASPTKRKIIGMAMKKSSFITVATKELYDKISSDFNESKHKLRRIPFGINNIEYAKTVNEKYSIFDCRKEFNIPLNKFVVFGGYNGNPAHRHIEIIHEIEKLEAKTKSQVLLVLFCSYSLSEDYKKRLEEEIRGCSFSCVLFTDYLTCEKLMRFRKCADVMLNLQATDVLSASMIESILVGNIVVKGNWLKYSEIENTVHFENINSFHELSEKISYIISNKSKINSVSSSNFNSVYELVSWKNNKEKWRSLL